MNGRFLSMEVLQAGTTLKRSTYVAYERDSTGLRGGSESLSYTDVNRRVQASRTIYHDDGGRFADESMSDFDGLGHYRTTVSSGNFSSGNDRTTRVTYNPSSGTYPGSFFLPSPSGPWILGTYDSQQVTEGSSSLKTTYCFDANAGFLNRKRMLAATTEGPYDVVTRYTADPANGEMIREEHFGGDVQALGTTALCSLALPSPQYRIDHTWRFGALATSRYADANGIPVSFFIVDRDIDRNTGLTLRSRDTAGIATSYEYDGLGRLTLVRPEAGHGGVTRYTYTQGTSSAPPRVDIELWNNAMTTVLSRRQSVQDAFGRPWKEKATFQSASGSAWATTETTLNALGWQTAVSSTEAADPPANWTVFTDHDAFGRAGRIRPPDGNLGTGYHITSLAFEGVRIERRTSSVQSSNDSGTFIETPVTVTSEYDRRGRLYRVIEGSGPNGENVTTTYTYDAADRMIQAQIQGIETTQTRTFRYDGRGFLLSDTHPELGTSGNGTVYFHEYDARGHARRRQGGAAGGQFDVRYTYDAAERLTAVAQNGSGTPIKQFVYGTSNGSGDWRNGKLVEATRWNPATWAPRTVRETYSYGGVGGRVSSRSTTILLSNGSTERAWQQSFVWNDLGQISRLGYPSQVAPASYTGRTVDFTYTDGRLTSIPGYLAMHYHANGLVSQVNFAGGPTWAQQVNAQQMARPAAISSNNTYQNWQSGEYRYDGSGNVAAIGTSMWFLYDRAKRLRYSSINNTGLSYFYDSFGNRSGADSATNRLGSGHTYDEAGNLTSDGTISLTYDWLSSQTSLYDGFYGRRVSYIYTPNDERLGAFDANSLQWRYTIRDLQGKVLSEYSDFGWTKDYILRDGAPAVTEQPAGVKRLFMLDHLGTPRQLTDWYGQVVALHQYDAFGQEITDVTADLEVMKFTGHERDFCCSDGAGNDYMDGRYYSWGKGPFLSADDSNGTRSSPQSWNRYSYELNNPTTFLKQPARVGTLCYPGQPVPPGGCTVVVIGPLPRGGGGGGPNPCGSGGSAMPKPGTDHQDAGDCGGAGGGDGGFVAPITRPVPPSTVPPVVRITPPKGTPGVIPWISRVCALGGAIIIGHDLGVAAGECVRDALFDRSKQQDCIDEAWAFLSLELEWCKQEYKGGNPQKLLQCEQEARRRLTARIEECRREYP